MGYKNKRGVKNDFQGFCHKTLKGPLYQLPYTKLGKTGRKSRLRGDHRESTFDMLRPFR